MSEDLKDQVRHVLAHGRMDGCDPRGISLLPIVDAVFSFGCSSCRRVVDVPWAAFTGDPLEGIERAIRELAGGKEAA